MDSEQSRIVVSAKKYILPFLAVIGVALYRPVFLWTRNMALFTSASEILPYILIPMVAAVFLLVVFRFIFKDIGKAALMNSIFISCFFNFVLIQSVFIRIYPGTMYWHTLSILVFLLAALGYFLHKKISADIAKTLTGIIGFVSIALIVVNIVSALITTGFTEKTQQVNDSTQQYGTNVSASPENKQNIYWLLFDEYSSLNFMEKYYDYDNTAFARHLEKKGFSVSYSSTNDCRYTTAVVKNIFALDYLFTMDTSNNPPVPTVISLVEENGYTVKGVGTTEKFYGVVPESTSGLPRVATPGGEGFHHILLGETPFYPFVTLNTQPLSLGVLNNIDYLKNIENFIGGSNFVLSHIVFPHTPFLFTEYGDLLPPEERTNWENKDIFLGQYKYATKLITNMIDTIVENDPNAIIVFISDHSARGPRVVNAPRTIYDNIVVDEYDMIQCFAAVYWGAYPKQDIEGMTGMNIMRTLINTVFHTNYDMLPPRIEIPEY
ncbi:MAG: LTA synthase family protein [Clostridium sp.]|nr:LTA synthase family protein [Clostridium sp.]